jgi:hypothetical protein
LSTFLDVTAAANLEKVLMPMGSNFGDIDNDGFLDIYLGTGSPSYVSLAPSMMLRNKNGASFVDVTVSSGTGEMHKGHGVAFADLDNDGDEDIAFKVGGATPGDAHAFRLFENPGHGNDWLGLTRHWPTNDHTAVMLGGGGDDFIFLLSNDAGQVVEVDAGTGDDQVAAHFGGAQYLLTLGRGRDVVIPHAIDGGGPAPIVTDFTPGPLGDIIDTSVAADPFAAGRWMLEQRGSDTVVLESGTGGWFDVLVLRDVDLASLTAENFNGDDPWVH